MTQVAIDTLDLSVSVASQPFAAVHRCASRVGGLLSASNTELLI